MKSLSPNYKMSRNRKKVDTLSFLMKFRAIFLAKVFAISISNIFGSQTLNYNFLKEEIPFQTK